MVYEGTILYEKFWKWTWASPEWMKNFGRRYNEQEWKIQNFVRSYVELNWKSGKENKKYRNTEPEQSERKKTGNDSLKGKVKGRKRRQTTDGYPY